MNKMNKVIVGIVILLVGSALFFGGFLLGQADASGVQNAWMMGAGQRGPAFASQSNSSAGCPYGSAGGMMGGYGMMGSGTGMLGGDRMMGGRAGMMGDYGFRGLTDVDPLSIEVAHSALDEYLASLGDDQLTVGEIMIFDNHAYAQIVDSTKDAGAFEVLIDPVSQRVYPEPGPNMMWNTAYGHMTGLGNHGMMGGMMGNALTGDLTTPDAGIRVTGQEAIEIAQRYLESNLPGATADETADAFPGYYTIHVLRDGETTGMLSVNAYSGQVFLHSWHGEFVEMTGDEHQ